MLTAREFQLTIKILNSKREIKIKDLAEEFKVSVRTIKYDLENVKDWLKEHDLQFHSQPNKGIWIECDESTRLDLRNRALQVQRLHLISNQSERVKNIVCSLLLMNTYMTAIQLADRLEVSRNTILNDMDQVEEFIKPWNISLERKPRIGYQLIGEEIHFRFLLEHIIQSDLSNYDVYQIINRVINKQQEETYLLIDQKIVPYYREVEQCLIDTFDSSYSKVFDSSNILTILIRLTISLVRLDMGCTLGSYRLINSKDYEDKRSSYLLSIMRNLFENSQFPLFEKEFLYASGFTDFDTTQIDVIKMTKDILEFVSEKENTNYKDDPKLFARLFAHFSLRFQNGAMLLTEFNPFTEDIKSNHLSLFNSIKEACSQYFGTIPYFSQDSTISFIALHFLVSYEDVQKVKVRVLYVCSTGSGVAGLINNRVTREIPDIELVACCSILEVDEICRRENPDLIISIFPISSSIPVVVVQSLPSKRDIDEIRAQVEILMNGRVLSSFEPSLPGKETVKTSEEINQEIIITGLQMNEELIELFGSNLEESKRQAFTLHVLLMIHRCYFQKQYELSSKSNLNLDSRKQAYLRGIAKVVDQHNLNLNESEIIGLLNYIN